MSESPQLAKDLRKAIASQNPDLLLTDTLKEARLVYREWNRLTDGVVYQKSSSDNPEDNFSTRKS